MFYHEEDNCFYQPIDVKDVFDECIEQGKDVTLSKGTKIDKMQMSKNTEVICISCPSNSGYGDNSIIERFREVYHLNQCKYSDHTIVYKDSYGHYHSISDNLPLEEISIPKRVPPYRIQNGLKIECKLNYKKWTEKKDRPPTPSYSSVLTVEFPVDLS